MKVQLNKRYFTPFLLVLVAEIAIAIFYFHRFVRGFLGDVLVIPLMYYLLRSISSLKHKPTILLVLLIGFITEVFQWLSLIQHLKMNDSFTRLVLGNTYDPLDLLAYVLGAILVLVIEKIRSQ